MNKAMQRCGAAMHPGVRFRRFRSPGANNRIKVALHLRILHLQRQTRQKKQLLIYIKPFLKNKLSGGGALIERMRKFRHLICHRITSSPMIRAFVELRIG